MFKDYTQNMTKITRDAFREATDELHSAEEAVDFLYKELITRSVRSLIEKFSKGRDLKDVKALIVDGIMAHHPDKEKEAVERRVRGWFDPKSIHSITKETAIEVAFILGLSLKEADEFIAYVSEEKLHWRDVQEIIYGFGLQYGLSYSECREIISSPEIQELLLKIKDFKTIEEIQEKAYTEFVKEKIKKIDSVEDLKKYLCKEYENLGNLHNMAFDMFEEMLGKLENPSQLEEDLALFGKSKEDDDKKQDKAKDELSDDIYEKVTIRDLLVDYFYCTREDIEKKNGRKVSKFYLVPQKKKAELNVIQKVIADKWPDEGTISRMRHREKDITRKSLILLFLATDGDYKKYDFYFEEDDSDYDLAEEEVFEDIFVRMNGMLVFGGYAPLDPRNPFDWLIIYCICVRDLFDIDPKIKEMIEELFRKEEEEKCVDIQF